MNQKRKKDLYGYIGITMMIFLILLVVTFVFEKPQIIITGINNNEKTSMDEVIIEAKSEERIENPIVHYHFRDISDQVIINDKNVDYDKVGEYSILYEIETLTGKCTKVIKIKIIDTKAPDIILEGGEEYNQSYSKEYEEPGYTAIDEVDGDLSNKIQVSREDTDDKHFKIKYDVKDKSGNKAEKVRNVTIVDDIKPEITLNGNSKITVYLNNKYEEKGAKAVDEIDGDLSSKISIEGSVDTSKEGTYTITYRVSDNSGNEDVKTRTVTVRKEYKAPALIQNNSNPNTGSKVIYLTFDDGPSSYTGALLDTLKRYNVKATFFVTKNGSDSMIKRAYDEGHTIALHTYTHDYSYVYSSVDNFFEDLYKIQSRVERITGHKSYLMRFPGGSSNTISKKYDGGIKIMSYLTNEVQNRGFTYFDWNVSSGDAGGTTSSNGVYNNVIKNLKSGSSVVLQHDIKKYSVDAVARIIEYGLENGYTFKPLTSSSPTAHHGINN